MKSDAELINNYKASSDMEAIGELYQRYIHLVYGVCLKYMTDRDDAQDAVMQVFEKLVTDLHKYEVNNFKSWLHVSAKNYCLMQIRSRKTKSNIAAEKISDVNNMEYSLVQHHEDETFNVDLEHVNPCIEALQVEQRKCMTLFYLEENSYKQIADKTGFDLKKVKSYIQNGKRNVKICIEKKRERAN